jgi:hypothetical protein
MGYNGVDYFSPENDYCIAADQLGWRLAHINRMFEDLGKPPVVRTWSSSPISPRNRSAVTRSDCHLRATGSNCLTATSTTISKSGAGRQWRACPRLERTAGRFCGESCSHIVANGVIVLAPSGAQ